jgi:hypothetical protein
MAGIAGRLDHEADVAGADWVDVELDDELRFVLVLTPEIYPVGSVDAGAERLDPADPLGSQTLRLRGSIVL